MTNRDLEHMAACLRPLMNAVDERDAATGRHSRRTVPLATALGRACGLNAADLDLLGLAAALHDVGKIGIPDRVLCKPGSLDDAEWALMRTHAERGARLLAAVPFEQATVLAQVARHHHEAFDGSGYPDGMAGEDIPLFCRIVALADSYEALSAPRAYHAPLTHRQVMDILHGENAGKYDPLLRQTFTRLMDARTGP